MASLPGLMHRTLHSIGTSLLVCGLLIAQQPVGAQEHLRPAPNESMRLLVGDIFEILPIHDIAGATYTWILTQDQNFLEASRAPSFRKRLTQPGQYTLYAEITSPDLPTGQAGASRRISRTFSLDYAARQPGEATAVTTTSNAAVIVQTEPAANDRGQIAVAAGSQLVRLIPVNPDVRPLALDLDLSRDSDNDGRPDNDIQGGETFFYSDTTPLFLWVTDDPLTTHGISVTAAMPDGARVQKLELMSEEVARAQGAIRSTVQVQTEQVAGRTYRFRAVFEDPQTAAAGQLLYQWDFGDGKQSLVTAPEHEYAVDGTYAVSLLVRNLRDGTEIATTSVALSVAPGITSAASSAAVSSQSVEEPATGGRSGIGIGAILLFVVIFIVSIALGIGIIVLLGKLRRGKTSLADKLESMEKTMVKSPTESKTPTLTIAPPTTPATSTENKRQEPPPSIAEREKEQETERPAPVPTPKPGATPAWLTQTSPKPAPAPTPSAQPQTSSPVAAPVQKPQMPTPSPAPVTPPKPAPVSPTQPQAPAWLQTPSTPAPQTPKALPATQPAPPPAPATPAPVQPVPAPVATPAPAPKPVQSAPAPTPTPAPQPSQPTESPAPAEQKPAAPVPQPTQAPAAEAKKSAPMDIPAADQPIAIIKAESLNEENNQQF